MEEARRAPYIHRQHCRVVPKGLGPFKIPLKGFRSFAMLEALLTYVCFGSDGRLVHSLYNEKQWLRGELPFKSQ